MSLAIHRNSVFLTPQLQIHLNRSLNLALEEA